MALWLSENATISQEALKSSSSSESASIPTISSESFFYEPDIVLGNVGKKFYPDDEIATNFLSLMAGHIMQSMESKDFEKKVYRKSSIAQISRTSVDKSTDHVSLDSVTLEKCANKTRKRKRLFSVYRSFSSASTLRTAHSESLQKSLSIKPENEIVEYYGEIEGEVEGEGMELTEDELISRLLANCPPNSYLASFYMERKLHNWTFKERDQEVVIVFRNGDRYFGRMSRMLMEGDGKYIWSDGTIYKVCERIGYDGISGTFKEGNADGSGSILWPDGSWYEGEMRCNKRHGHGITHKMTPDGDIYHYGEYRFGRKHGNGVLVFDKNNFYDGEFKFGKRDGFGTRFYPTGAMYCGEWSNGMRSGYGTMIWPNNDVYTGWWRMGFMHGHGKYTWGAFRNSRFVAPQLNVFAGNFFEGKRKGFGHLQLASGGSVYTNWFNKEKSGNGEIVCRNGNKLYARNLFFEDRSVEVDLTGVLDYNLPENEDDIELLNLMEEEELMRRVKPRFVDVNGPVHKMDFSSHINKLFEIDYDVEIPMSPEDPVCTVDKAQCEAIRALETTWLEKVIMQRMADLNLVYSFYSTIGLTNEKPEFRVVMLRIMLYQLLRDCGIKETGYSAVQFDQMVGIGSEPFDKVLMYEMIHYLLTLCMLTRMKPRTLNSKIPGVLAATFDRFIEEVVLKSMEKYNGTFLKFLKTIPLQAVYKLFKTFESPLRIKDLCERLINPYNEFTDKMPFTPEYFLYSLQGNNTVFADGSFGYVPFEEPFFDLKKESLYFEEIEPSDFSVFADLGFGNIARCIAEVVPEAISPSDGQLAGDYMLSFLDFCDILVNFATQYLDLCEQFYKTLKTEERSAPTATPSVDRNDSDLLKQSKKPRSSKGSRKSMFESKSQIGESDSMRSKSKFFANPWVPKKIETKDLESLN